MQTALAPVLTAATERVHLFLSEHVKSLTQVPAEVLCTSASHMRVLSTLAIACPLTAPSLLSFSMAPECLTL